MFRLLRNPHFLSVASQGLSACLGFGSFLILVRALEPTSFGVWTLYLAAATILDMARSGFVHSGLVRYASAGSPEDRRIYIGSGLLLTSVATLALVVPLGFAGFLTDESIGEWRLFFDWWPLLALVSLPVQFAGWVQQSASRFDRVLIVRSVVNGTFLLLVVIGFVLETISVKTSAGWIRLSDIRHATRPAVRTLSRFGLFSTGTLVGSNALKSSDTFLLGALLGPLFVGLYAAAQRAVEALEIPLRGLSASIYPDLSRAAQAADARGLLRRLTRVTALATAGMIPLSIGLLVGAEFVIQVVAGPEYLDAVGALRMFAVAILFLPTDRFTGLALDSLGKPGLNTAKVLTMVAVNIVGDVIAIMTLGTIEAVAAVTCVMMATGAVLGIALVRRELGSTRSVVAASLAELMSTGRLVWRRL
jgi:O-antigen/teichoic acid export membrane protein